MVRNGAEAMLCGHVSRIFSSSLNLRCTGHVQASREENLRRERGEPHGTFNYRIVH
jgi:hypothetical protein